MRNIGLRVIGPSWSHGEIKIDVWKYLGPILSGQYAVCLLFVDNHNRAHGSRWFAGCED